MGPGIRRSFIDLDCVKVSLGFHLFSLVFLAALTRSSGQTLKIRTRRAIHILIYSLP
jgi:hypothetical protein